MQNKYKALVVSEVDNKYIQEIKELSINDLHKNSILIEVHYSSLNYKDALSATGNKGVTKSYPHTPGIDAAGVVVKSDNDKFSQGDKVIVTGYDLGMNTYGGFGQYISVPTDWVIHLPKNMTMKESMIIGTAGFTAAVMVKNLTDVVPNDRGEILVSGATGGVGSTALNILSKIGYKTVALTGKTTEITYLEKMGATSIMPRNEFEELNKKPILSARYAGALDTVGGVILENMIKTVYPFGVVTTCGSVSGTNLSVSVFPFILRGISLMGVSAQNYPMEKRESIWNNLAGKWRPDQLFESYTEISIDEIPKYVELILQGKIKGRTLIDCKK